MTNVRPSRRPLCGLLRMRFFLYAIKTLLILRSALGDSRGASRRTLVAPAAACPCYTLRQQTVANEGETPMRRRDLLNAGLAAAASLAMPRLARADKAKTLVFVPTSDLAVLDPVVTFNRPTRNYAYLVFDTLYGIDTSWQAQPQMVQGHEVDDDGLTWNLRLREAL